jgi:hypothetical protein
MQAFPEPMQLSLDECMQTTLQTEQLLQLCSYRSDRSTSPIRPVDKIAQHLGTTSVRPVYLTSQADATWETVRPQNKLETTWKPSKCMKQAKSCSNFSPLLAMHETSKKCKKCNLELLK